MFFSLKNYYDVWAFSVILLMLYNILGDFILTLGGLLYLVGGRTNSSCEKLESITSVETYDPFSNKWSNIAKLSATRHRLGITALDGVIYAVGGSDGTVCLNTVEKYDAENDIWNPVASMSARRMGEKIDHICDNNHQLKLWKVTFFAKNTF